MVLEQVLTIIFAVGVGAALIVYAARPRHRGASLSVGASAIGSFAPAEMVQAAPMPQVADVESPVAVISPPEAPAVVEVAPVVADVAPAGPVEVASSTAFPAAVATSSISETVESPAHTAVTTRRAQRKKSTATKSRARSTRKAKAS
ncbi:MAG: hypothetical protein OK441_04720 [Thaumarchaeota archaeon]|nr:hypothetical protein [Nitrososphaerota archaeon]